MARARRKPRHIARRGLMLVLSSPSGAGKTTLSRMLLKADRNVELSVSVTTRPKRRGELEGRDYHFIDAARFDAMVKAGGCWNGRKCSGTATARRAGRWRRRCGPAATCCSTSTGRVRSSCAKRRATISSASSSCRRRVKELERRLKRRAQDSRAIIGARMAKAAGEMSHWPEYDYVIVNQQ